MYLFKIIAFSFLFLLSACNQSVDNSTNISNEEKNNYEATLLSEEKEEELQKEHENFFKR